jgi:UDP-3-O-[3-hydroxymyristoyl] glucosamine N-acyltransferase
VLSKKKLRGPGMVFWGRPAQPLRAYLKGLAAVQWLAQGPKEKA